LFSTIEESSTRSATPSKPFISIIEVGPRDGLQNERKCLSVDQRFDLITRLEASGLRHIEIGSMVDPTRIPQMANTKELVQRAFDIDAFMSVLVPSEKQFRTLMSSHQKSLTRVVDEIVLFVAASESFNAKNIGTNVDGAFKRFHAIQKAMNEIGWDGKIRGSISCCWGCPYEGRKSSADVAQIVARYEDLGVDMIDLCDTIGDATPHTTEQLLSFVQSRSVTPLSLHMHEKNGDAIDSCMKAVQMGVRTLQSSIAGIGGCPFSITRPGNVDTLKLVQRLHDEQYETGIDEVKLEQTARWIRKKLVES